MSCYEVALDQENDPRSTVRVVRYHPDDDVSCDDCGAEFVAGERFYVVGVPGSPSGAVVLCQRCWENATADVNMERGV